MRERGQVYAADMGTDKIPPIEANSPPPSADPLATMPVPTPVELFRQEIGIAPEINTIPTPLLEPTMGDFIKELTDFIGIIHNAFLMMEQKQDQALEQMEQLLDSRIKIENITSVLRLAEANTHISVETFFSMKINIEEVGEITCLQALSNKVGIIFLHYSYEGRNGKFPFRNAITKDNLNAYTKLKDSPGEHSALTMLLSLATDYQSLVLNFIGNNNLIELFDPNLLDETHNLSETYITTLSHADICLPWLIENVPNKKFLMNNDTFLKALLMFPDFNYILMQPEYFNLIEHKTLAANFPDGNLAASIINFMISKTNILSPSNYIVRYDQHTGIYVYFMNYETASENGLEKLIELFKKINKQTSSNSLDEIIIIHNGVFTISSSLRTIVNFFNLMKQRLAMIPIVDWKQEIDVSDELYSELVEDHLIPDLKAFFSKYEQIFEMDAAEKEIFDKHSKFVTGILDILKKLPLKVAFSMNIDITEKEATLAHYFTHSTIMLFLKTRPRYIKLFNQANLNTYLPLVWNQINIIAPQSPLFLMLIAEDGPQFIAENGLVRFLDPNMFSEICIPKDEEFNEYVEKLLVNTLMRHAETEKWFVDNCSELILENKYLEKFPHLVNNQKVLSQLLKNKKYEYLLRKNLIIESLTNETVFSIDTSSNCTFAESLLRYQLLQNIPNIKNNHYNISISKTTLNLSFNNLTKKQKTDLANAVKLFNAFIKKEQSFHNDCLPLSKSNTQPYTISGNFYKLFRFISFSELALKEITADLSILLFETKPKATLKSTPGLSSSSQSQKSSATKKPMKTVPTPACVPPRSKEPVISPPQGSKEPVSLPISQKAKKSVSSPDCRQESQKPKRTLDIQPEVVKKSVKPQPSNLHKTASKKQSQVAISSALNKATSSKAKNTSKPTVPNKRQTDIQTHVAKPLELQTDAAPMPSIEAHNVLPFKEQVDPHTSTTITNQAKTEEVDSTEISQASLPREITRHHFFQPPPAQPELIEFDPAIESAIETLESFFATAEPKPTLHLFGSQVINAILIKHGLTPMKPNDVDVILIGDAANIIPFLIKNHFSKNTNNPDFPIWVGKLNNWHFEISIKDEDVMDPDMTITALRAERYTKPNKKTWMVLDPTRSAIKAIVNREIELCNKTSKTYLLKNPQCLFRIIRYHLDGFTIHSDLLNVIKKLKISFETISQKDLDHLKAIIRKNIHFGDTKLFISKMIELGLLKKILNINIQPDNIDWPKLLDCINERVKKVSFYQVDSQTHYKFIQYPPPLFNCSVKQDNYGNRYTYDHYNNTYLLDGDIPLLIDKYGKTNCPFLIICNYVEYVEGKTNVIIDQFGQDYSFDDLGRLIYFHKNLKQNFIVEAIQIPLVESLSQSYIQDVCFLQDNRKNYYVRDQDSLYRVNPLGILSKVDKFYNDVSENVPQIRVSATMRLNLFSMHRHSAYLKDFGITMSTQTITSTKISVAMGRIY